MIERILDAELQFSKTIMGLRLPAKLRPASRLFVRIGDGWFWLPVTGCIFVKEPRSEFFAIARHCMIALAISLALYWSLKLTVRRLRPFQQLPGTTTELPPLDKFSFPSGHTMNNLAIGLVVAHYFPSLLYPMVLLPIAWGLFRIYFGLHFLSDVIAGGLLGILSFQLS